MALSRVQRLHLLSTKIGKYERIADSGVISEEIKEARTIIENSDTMQAMIDRYLVDESMGVQ